MEFSFENGLDPKNRVVALDYNPEDVEVENPLRPCQLPECIGQQKVKENLAVFMEAAKQRKETLDYVLLRGLPGLGRTTLADIITNEMGVGVRITSGSTIKKPDDLATISTNLFLGDALFTDEIHRLSRSVEETLYLAMEDFALDIIIGKRQMVALYHLPLPPFTLVGVTTCTGQFSTPLHNHFGVVLWLELYSPEELTQTVTRSAGILGIPIESEGALELVSRSRGTSYIANRLLRRVCDFAQVINDGAIIVQAARRALERLEVDEVGPDANDRCMLCTTIEYYRGGLVRLDTLVTAIGEEPVTLEDAYEPYLIQIGFLNRAPCGCCVIRSTYLHLGLTPPGGLMGAQ